MVYLCNYLGNLISVFSVIKKVVVRGYKVYCYISDFFFF